MVLFFFFGLISGLAAQMLFASISLDSPNRESLVLLVGSLFSLIPALVIGWICGRFLEDLPLKALGFSFSGGWLNHLFWGLLFGAATLMLAVGIAAVVAGFSFRRDATFDGSSIGKGLIVSFAIFAISAAFEETLFRGYILQTFTRAGLSWLAIALTSLFFGMVHLGNPNANAVSTANTALAGVWFGLAYLKSRDLWFPFGVHLIWNWMQGSIFGIEVSGLRNISGASLFNEVDNGPAWITGGDYGIEAGIVTTIAIIASIAAIRFLPFPKADKEMLELTSKEQPVRSTVS